MQAVADNDDRQAFHDLVRLVSPKLYGAARPMVVDVSYVDDLVQETLTRVWKYRKGFRGAALPSTWMIAIMRNVAKSANLRPSDTTFGLHLGTEAVDEVSDMDTEVRARAIDAALAQLDADHRKLIVRRYLHNHSWERICVEMGYSTPYFAKKAFAQAKDALAKLLDISPTL